MINVLMAMIKKEFMQMLRSKPMIAIIFGMPVIQLIVIGFAVTGDVEHVPTVITDLDNSSRSRDLVSVLEHSRYLDVRYKSRDIRTSESILQQGDVIIALTIPSDFGKQLARNEQPDILITADAQDSNVALTGAGYVKRIINSWIENQGIGVLRKNVSLNLINLESHIWYNPELKSSFYMVPGIFVILVTVITVLLTAMAIVRERGESNTLEQLMVTPITRAQIIFGKTIPFGIMGLLVLSVSLGVAKLIYNIPIEGSLPVFYAMSIVFIFSTIGLGIFISTITSTQQQALFTAWFIIVFCFLMSGFLLPLDNIPRSIYVLTYLNPLRYYLTIVRELFLKGLGFAELWHQVAALAGIALVILAAAVSRFHKRLG